MRTLLNTLRPYSTGTCGKRMCELGPNSEHQEKKQKIS